MFRYLLLTLVMGFIVPMPAHAGEFLGQKRAFWVWNLHVFPHGYREATATLAAKGERTNIYLEEGLRLPPGYLARLRVQLEKKAPSGALFPEIGILASLEKLFGALPASVRGEARLNILFTNLGRPEAIDGYFAAADQLSEADAAARGAHSNEANIVYVNGYQGNDDSTAAAFTHGLQELLAHARRPDAVAPDLWLGQTLGEAALLSVGLFSDQARLNRYVQTPGEFPLVSHSLLQYGPQLLFASYLLDQAGDKGAALRALAEMPVRGREAVESVFRNETGTPLTFDLIYGNFLAYIFRMAERGERLPFSVQREKGRGLLVPEIRPYMELKMIPAIMEGSVYPYAFALFDLPEELPPTAIVEVQPVRRGQRRADGTLPCSETATVLWKPVTQRRIAVYAVGCEHETEQDRVQFRLSVLDRPF